MVGVIHERPSRKININRGTKRPPEKTMKRPTQLLAMAVVSCNNLAPQIAALLILSPGDFGTFSLGYLTFSLAASVALSTVSEAYVRAKTNDPIGSVPKNYAAISTWLSAIFALISSAIFSILSDSYLAVLLSAIAVGCAARRTTIRYHELQSRCWRKLLPAETVALGVFIVALSASFSVLEPMVTILFAWSASGLSIWFLGTMRRPGTLKAAMDWISRHRREIRPLLRESMVQEISAIGTPYVLAPMLGTASFGIYRAVSNFNAPVRLVFNFLRPYIANSSLDKSLSAKSLFFVCSLSLAWGTIFSAILLFIAERPSGIAMLDALAEFWLPAGIYMVFAVGVMYFYIIARTKVNATNLLWARLFQSSVSIVFPVTGVVLGELTGALWGSAMATMVGTLIWFCVLQIQVRYDSR